MATGKMSDDATIEWRVPKNLEPGMFVRITKSAHRPWWAFWRPRQVTETRQVMHQSGQTFELDDGSSITLASKVWP